jgi:hypothetical protein
MYHLGALGDTGISGGYRDVSLLPGVCIYHRMVERGHFLWGGGLGSVLEFFVFAS